MRNFIFYTLKFLSLSAIIICINISIDYRSPERGITKSFIQDLKKFDSLTLKVNLPERLLVKNIIINGDINNPNLVLGSSRSLLIGKNISTNVFNLSVSGAILKDFTAIFDLLKKYNTKVSTIYLEISPWILNHNVLDQRYKEFKNSNHKRVLSYNYFFENITFPKYTVVNNSGSFRKYSDGSINYGYKYSNDYKEKINAYIKGIVYHLEGFNKIEKLNFENLLQLIKDIKSAGIELVFVKHPYPPSINKIILKRYPNIVKTDSIINNLSKEFKIKTLGSFYPEEIQIMDSDFYDGMHLNPEGTKKLLCERLF